MPRYEVEAEVVGAWTQIIEADDELQAEEILKRDLAIDNPNITVYVDAYDIDD
jgi:hypothetical protein